MVQCALASELYKLCGPQPGELSWHVGRRLPGIKKEHFSFCYYCKKDYPETVAYLIRPAKSNMQCILNVPSHTHFISANYILRTFG